MVSSCCVKNCTNRRVKETPSCVHLRFYRIPKSNKEERRAKWLKAIGKGDQWQPSTFSRVCSDHFIIGEKSDNKQSPNYVPCIFRDTSPSEKRRLQKLFDIHSRQVAERTKKINAATMMLSVVEQELVANWRRNLSEGELLESRGISGSEEIDLKPEMLYVDGNFVDPKKQFSAVDGDVRFTEEVEELLMKYSKKKKVPHKIEKGTQTILAHDYIRSLEQECANLRSELMYFQGKFVFKEIKLQSFINAEDKIKYLTGLECYKTLKVLSDTLSCYQSKMFKLTSFQQLLMTLMKLRLGFSFPFLAITFDIEVSAVVQLFVHTIDLLINMVVPHIIFWPDNEEMKKVLPSEFKNSGNCMYVADCFDVQVQIANEALPESFEIEKSAPNAPEKSHWIRRYFIAIAPQGSIIFISKGRHHELQHRAIALESGFFDNVGPGDTIITERDLDIDDEVDVRGAVVKMSSSVKTRVLSETDDEGPHGLVRIKWVAHLLKQKNQILDGKMPLNWVKGVDRNSSTTLDKIVHVCCALYNLTNKVWTFEKFLGPVKEDNEVLE